MKYAILISIVPAIIHIGFFCLESLFWGRQAVNKIFKLRTKDQIEFTRLLALNQGYYNLFLAIAIISGIIISLAPGTVGLDLIEGTMIGKTLVIYSLLSIIGAGIVLLISAKNVRGATLQALPALIALGILFL